MLSSKEAFDTVLANYCRKCKERFQTAAGIRIGITRNQSKKCPGLLLQYFRYYRFLAFLESLIRDDLYI
jgi:hypothetical protein